MKIIEEYKLVKQKHSNFFRKYNANDRIKYAKEIITLKREIDEIESKIISGILNFTLNYNRVYYDLHSKELHGFLIENDGVKRFLSKQKVSDFIGYDENQRNQVIKDFKKLCEKVWEDYIITADERKELNDFCESNLIDKTQQFLIEQEVSKRYTDGFDLIKIVEHYYSKENLSYKKIEEILDREYKKKVSLSRITSIISQLDKKISADIKMGGSKSQLIKTINYANIMTIYLIVVDGNITSGFEFEIGYKEGENDSFKIMISKTTHQGSDETRLIDIVTDGLCYYMCNNSMNIRHFLEQKSIIREGVQSSF